MFWLYVGIGLLVVFVICKVIDGRRPVDRRRLGRSIKNTEIDVSQYDNDLNGRSPF